MYKLSNAEMLDTSSAPTCPGLQFQNSFYKIYINTVWIMFIIYRIVLEEQAEMLLKVKNCDSCGKSILYVIFAFYSGHNYMYYPVSITIQII